jgi:hypothetical protein
MKVTTRGWPWQTIQPFWANSLDRTVGQKYGWNPFSVKDIGRFGGGWAFKLGVIISFDLRDIVLDLGLGSIRINLKKESNHATD